MDRQKVLEVLKIYERRFLEEQVTSQRFSLRNLLPKSGFRRIALAHLSFMIHEIREFPPESSMDKTFRWLGFIQGVLWALRIYTIEDLKNHNRPAE